MKILTDLLGVERLKTTTYHPQANAVVERMHATLESMLRKAHALGLNCVSQIPFALFAMRQAPSRRTGFSPFELVYCRNVWTPLDVLCSRWREERLAKL